MSTTTRTPGTPGTPGTTGATGGAVTDSTRYPLGWLRGIAALVVLTFHAYQHNRYGPASAWPLTGWAHQLMLGSDALVDMFFVLSGLVLWLPIARAAGRGDTGRPGRLLLYRRMARLLPLYWAIVLVVWALTNPVLPGHWVDLVSHLTFTHVYSNTYIFWTDGPAWSLGVEVQLYVVMAMTVPLLHAGVRRTRPGPDGRRIRLLLASVLPALLVVGSLTYLVWATVWSPHADTDWRIWYSPASRGADFGLGMLLAVLGAAGVRLGGRARLALAAGGVLGLAVLVTTRPSGTATGEWWHPMFSLAVSAGLAAIVLCEGPWPAWMSWRPLVWVGGLGYGIYLIHEPVMRFLDHVGALPAARPGPAFLVTAVLVAVPTLALAWVSSRTIEAAGVRMLATLDRDGSPRDFYAHVKRDEDDLVTVTRR